MGIAKELKNKEDREKDLKIISDEELKKLQEVLLKAYLDIQNVCDKHGIRIMLGGGSCLGAVRHGGVIPWDDDLDVNMPRGDYEKLKEIFQKELGERYILNAPGYSKKKTIRFPRIILKNTRLVEAGFDKEAEYSGIHIDVFIIENAPKNRIFRILKGLYCRTLMLIEGSVGLYRMPKERFLQRTKAAHRRYWPRRLIGRLFSFKTAQYWLNAVDRVCHYEKETGIVSIPTGRNHYFGEMQPKETFIPMSRGMFEGHEVNLPGDPHAYLTKLYGADYMTPPPPEKRERHSFVEIDFGDY